MPSGRRNPQTWYFSHVTEQTERSWLSGRYYPRLRMNPAMLPMPPTSARKSFLRPPIPVAGFDAATGWENDGAVPTNSQMYPRISGEHPVGGEFASDTPADSFAKGRWYYKWERDVDHLDICVCPEPGQIGWQRRFYIDLLGRLAAFAGVSSRWDHAGWQTHGRARVPPAVRMAMVSRAHLVSPARPARHSVTRRST
jgi:hypothetical protein